MIGKVRTYIEKRVREIDRAKDKAEEIKKKIDVLKKKLDDYMETIKSNEGEEEMREIEKDLTEITVNDIELEYWMINQELFYLTSIFERPDKKGKDRIDYLLKR